MTQLRAVNKTNNDYSPVPSQPVHRHSNAGDKLSRIESAARWLRGKLGGREGSLKEMIEDALQEDSTEGGLSISPEEKELLKNMVHFGELTVRDVMVPRTEIMGVSRNISIDQLKTHVAEIGHTRIPVYDDSLDKIEGFIHVKDLFSHLGDNGGHFELASVMHEILFVPPSMRIVDLLLKMRVSGCHMAIVVDEYGGTSGLVTMEDLFEELVGEIQDEHDDAFSETMLRWIGGDVLEVNARAKIGQVEEALGEMLHTEGEAPADYDTLGGFIFFTLGRVPVKGEVLKLKTFKIEIAAADPRRIRQVRITRLTAPPVAVA